MADERLKIWEKLFGHVLSIFDEAVAAGAPARGWSFGGGTVLMRRHRHRISKDVDIFVPDPQWLGYLTPRLNSKAESLAADYVEQAGFVKLYFPEGEIDFVVSGALTTNPTLTGKISSAARSRSRLRPRLSPRKCGTGAQNSRREICSTSRSWRAKSQACSE
jgi:hypothetical protein